TAADCASGTPRVPCPSPCLARRAIRPRGPCGMGRHRPSFVPIAPPGLLYPLSRAPARTAMRALLLLALAAGLIAGCTSEASPDAPERSAAPSVQAASDVEAGRYLV